MSELFFDRRLGFAPPAEQARIQAELLRQHVAWCRQGSPYYRRLLAGAEPDAASPNALAKLPVTTKEALENFNDEFLAVPRERVVDIVLSSGTTGKPTRIMYSERDLQRLAYNEEMAFGGCGLTAADTVLLTCTMDRCFIAGLAYYLGVRALGAGAIRNGHGSMESHLAVMRQMHPTAIVGVPSFLRKLGRHAAAHGPDPRPGAVSRLICIGEPLRGRDMRLLALGADLEALWGARVYSTYATSEIVTTFCECEAQCGGHWLPELGLVEILDDQDRPVPAGTPGEVTVTPLQAEAMPLLRFRTGDISFLITEPCRCGRTSPRLGPILGRRRQMLKVRGTTLYPPALCSALDEMAGVSDYYIEARSGADLSDELTVHAAVADGAVDAGQIRERLQARVRVTPEVVIEPEERIREKVFDPASRKPVRFVDRRKPVA